MRWMQRIRNVFRPERLNREIDREITFHVSERADDLRAQGLPPEAARSEARRMFGNAAIQADEVRDSSISALADSALRILGIEPTDTLREAGTELVAAHRHAAPSPGDDRPE